MTATTFTKKQINHIAAESKRCCHHGHGMSVFANGDCMFAISENDVIARGAAGGWDYAIAYIDRPMTRAQVAEHLGNS